MIWVLKNLYGYTKLSVKLFYSQAFHETGDFKSPVYVQNKNLFGMRHPSKRKTFSKGSNLGHAVFKNHWDSIRDYFERCKNFKLTNGSDSLFMVETVKSRYAEDKDYLKKWERIYGSIKLPINNTFLFIGVFFLVLISMLLFRKDKEPKSTIYINNTKTNKKK